MAQSQLVLPNSDGRSAAETREVVATLMLNVAAVLELTVVLPGTTHVDAAGGPATGERGCPAYPLAALG